MSDFAER